MATPTRRLLHRYLAPQWRSVVALAVLLAGMTAIQIAHPRLFATFIDASAEGEPVSVLTRVAVAFIGLALAGQVIGIADTYVAEHVALVATNRLRADLTRHTLSLDLGFHGHHRPGELIERIDGDTANLANFLSRFLVAIAGNVLLLIGVAVMLAFVDPRLGVMMLVFVAALLALSTRFRRLGRPHWERAMEAEAELAGTLEEQLSGTEDLRSLGASPYAMRVHAMRSRTVLQRFERAALVGNIVPAAVTGAFRIGAAAALGVAAWMQQRGSLSIGEVFLVFAYTQVLNDPVQALSRQIEDLQTALAAIHRVEELLGTRSAIDDNGTAELPLGALAVAFDGVTFSYDADAETPTLSDVSFSVAPGQVLGLLGRTGSGKTTIAKLLVRFRDVAAGGVRLSGIDVRDVPLRGHRGLRERVALVTQDVHLFHASVRDNVTLFDPTVDDHRIVSVLDELGLGPWLASLETGLDTMLAGDTALSAGESQLLAFARVFLRDPGVVILDEATARLDPATEARVESAVARLFSDRTAIVIAHRLSTVMRADEILVLDDGAVTEHGSRVTLTEDPSSRFSALLRIGLEDVGA